MIDLHQYNITITNITKRQNIRILTFRQTCYEYSVFFAKLFMQIIGHSDPPRSLTGPLNWNSAHVPVATNLASYRAQNVGIPARSSREDASESRWVLIKCRGECRCTITVKAPCTRSLNTRGGSPSAYTCPLPHACHFYFYTDGYGDCEAESGGGRL